MSKLIGKFVWKGGPGSGHRGHAGRPGKRGGSLPGSGGGGGQFAGYAGELDLNNPHTKEMLLKAAQDTGRREYGKGFIFDDDAFVGQYTGEFASSAIMLNMGEGWEEMTTVVDMVNPENSVAYDNWSMDFVFDPTTGKSTPLGTGSATFGDRVTRGFINDFYNNPTNKGKYLATYGAADSELIVWKPGKISSNISEDLARQHEKAYNAHMGY